MCERVCVRVHITRDCVCARVWMCVGGGGARVCKCAECVCVHITRECVCACVCVCHLEDVYVRKGLGFRV